ncbi:MAG: hypothetical protein PWR08_702 [Thermoanaerobacterium sp.]|nr:hypothetical protein [Thermoanaerobacterium sp.]MDN5316578.1 hypothetical protein [Thermoanaerobacterium sp.]
MVRINISDIASIVGVSPATVSNALNGKSGVSEETRQKIIKIAREYGYFKDNIFNTLQKTIRFIMYKKHGFVVCDTPFFTSLIEGITKESKAQGYELLISHVNFNEKDNKELIETIEKDYSEGILILATEMTNEDLTMLKNVNVPVVMLDSYFKNSDFDSVLINNSEAAYKATEYLIMNGHTNVGYLHSSVYINNFYYRRRGYLEALSDYALKADKKFEFALEPTAEGSYRDMSLYLKQKNIALPTAFFADNDIIALGAMRALKESGIKIPEDVSIIGFDDMPFCEISTPKLTTLKVFKQEMGKAAVRRLVDKIKENDNSIQKIEINTQLVIRESVLKIN